jgi:hypothetical protein
MALAWRSSNTQRSCVFRKEKKRKEKKRKEKKRKASVDKAPGG